MPSTTPIETESGNAPGVLLVLNDILENVELEFNRWYLEQHLPERLAIDGFKRARRYKAVDGQPAYMTVYDCDSVQVLASPAYRERLANPTAWTNQIMPCFRNILRAACQESWSAGEGMGGAAIVVQCKPIHGMETEARQYITESLAPFLLQSDCVVRIALWEADAAITDQPCEEIDLRGAKDNGAHWILFIESYDLAQLALVLHSRILSGDGAASGLLIGSWLRYQLICERAA
ncbi:DUF4286 family protein [Lacisediminimonas profundi]|uniref:DUF4286 family protein n=1 Tax=Lacisediminimonas profundi TaxID=2603856 RepID=UPI00124BBB15|nr:DUF4286 family protein [Lacisediminimonas profundi]